MANGFKGIRKTIIGLVVFAAGFYLEVTQAAGTNWMWIGVGVAAGGNVWDFVVERLSFRKE